MHFLPVLMLVLIGTATQSDSPVPEEQVTAPLETQTHGVSSAQPPSYDEIDPLLMCMLALAAVAFQFRRRYRASQRAWQRIFTPTDPVALQPGAATPRSPPRATMRWQQTH